MTQKGGQRRGIPIGIYIITPISIALVVGVGIFVSYVCETLTPEDLRFFLGLGIAIVFFVVITLGWVIVQGVTTYMRIRAERADDIGEIMRANRSTNPVNIAFDQQGAPYLGNGMNGMGQYGMMQPSMQQPWVEVDSGSDEWGG